VVRWTTLARRRLRRRERSSFTVTIRSQLSYSLRSAYGSLLLLTWRLWAMPVLRVYGRAGAFLFAAAAGRASVGGCCAVWLPSTLEKDGRVSSQPLLPLSHGDWRRCFCRRRLICVNMAGTAGGPPSRTHPALPVTRMPRRRPLLPPLLQQETDACACCSKENAALYLLYLFSAGSGDAFGGSGATQPVQRRYS